MSVGAYGERLYNQPYEYIYIYIYIYIYRYIYINCLCGSVAKASDIQAVGHVLIRASSGPLINFIKLVLKYYLEVRLYNCV